MKSLRSQNYYEILGISRFASPEEIRNAYELSKLTFTQNSMATYSLFSEEENEEILELISKAYETLLNPELRREYDSFLDGGGQGSHHAWEARKPPPAPSRAPGRSAPQPPLGEHAPPRAAPAGAAAAPNAAPREQSARERTPPAPKTSPAGELRAKESPPAPPRAAEGPQSELERYLGSVEHYTGEVLRRVRELRGMSLFELCAQTKIRQTYADYVETENFASLPAPVYVRGFVKLMATSLGLPPEEVAQDYMARYRAGKRA